ncbi:beta-1,4 N-acetylgalactosaminyltransferase 1-like [Gouania willdenowi]|nr:beta-1,4 N-acetylgalactosaminyltransferase 1-like [Gouania willdenowi]XP_028321577.1 beta-1,4 N-acetylgalactosaminyltransferase 1-like [Gouania willdenowi]
MMLCFRSKVKVLSLLCVVLLIVLCYLEFIENPKTLLEKKFYPKKQEKKRELLYTQPPPDGACSCSDGATMFKHLIPDKELEDLSKLRAQEFKTYKIRTASLLSTPLHALPNSPLQFPIQGYVVRPLTRTVIPDLGLQAEDQSSYEVSLKSSKGLFFTDSKEGVTVTGSGESNLMMKSSSLVQLNELLSQVKYESKAYHVNDGDLVSFKFETHEAVFPVIIKQPEMPFLRDLGKDINSHVTVATKIKMEYSPVRTLVDSIRKFYPKIPIVIVDENTEREEIKGVNIEQYFMPPKKGWFAGRSLAVTQVNTKYFLWVDDNFQFSESTKIEKFVEIMEANPELDVLGGVIRGKKCYFTLLYEEGDDVDGGCLHMKFDSKFNTVPHYPQCSLVSGVANFFLGRADAVMAVGFDPNLNQTANPEFFIDGLGSLMVASCDDPSSMIIELQDEDLQENSFDLPDAEQTDYRHHIYYFKNHLKCAEYL